METPFSTPSDEGRRLDCLINELSSTPIQFRQQAISAAVEGTIREIVELTHVDRGSLMELSGPRDTIDALYEYPPPSISDEDSGQDPRRWSWIVQRLANADEPVVYGSTREGARGELPQGVASAIGIPVSIGEHHMCMLALETFATPRAWPNAIVERLRNLAGVLAAELDRLRREATLFATRAGPVARTPRPGEGSTPGTRSSGGGFGIAGESAPLRAALTRLQQVAATDATVLLLGETGTGKELFARALHASSARVRYPLVTINCAALPPSLVESELFGYERGAFTGAIAQRRGRFEVAHRGTLFLDEIGDLPLDIQAKLLRVLQDRTFERLGSSQTQTVDVRIVAATHRRLEDAVAGGAFREDLYYRLNVFPIRMPALRDRLDDIPALVWAIVRKRQQAMRRSIATVPASVISALQAHSWPGNVRELQNVIERGLIHSTGDVLVLADEDFDVDVRPLPQTKTLKSVERAHIQEVLQDCEWRINGSGNAAERLGLHPNTLRFRMKKLGIGRDNSLSAIGVSSRASRAS
jgi:formate hydrogenlyase transcriptional activator